MVDVDTYVELCMFELCSCNLKTKCACAVFTDYAESCAAEDILVPWTREVTECGK